MFGVDDGKGFGKVPVKTALKTAIPTMTFPKTPKRRSEAANKSQGVCELLIIKSGQLASAAAVMVLLAM